MVASSTTSGSSTDGSIDANFVTVVVVRVAMA